MTEKILVITCEAAAYIPYKEIMAFQGNLKSLSKENNKRLREEILKYGFNSAVDVWKDGKNKFNLDSHQRLIVVEELEKEGYLIPPIPVNWIKANSLKDAKHILLSRVSQYGKVQETGLKAYLNSSGLTVDDIKQSFSLPDVDMISFEKDFYPKTQPTDKENIVPSVPKLSRSKRGDIWELGNHRIMCGDSTSITDVNILMNDKKAQMVLTDPPYGVAYKSNARTRTEKFNVLENDTVILDIAPVIEKFSEGFVFIWTTWKVVHKWIKKMESLGIPTNMVIWHKPGGGLGDLKKTFSTDYEIALVWHRNTPLAGKRIGSVWNISKDAATKYEHPTQKPVELSDKALENCSHSGYLVMDLFLGSGSTLISCEKLGRKCYGMEITSHYLDVVIERWQKYTGKEATRIDSNGIRTPWSQITAA